MVLGNTARPTNCSKETLRDLDITHSIHTPFIQVYGRDDTNNWQVVHQC